MTILSCVLRSRDSLESSAASLIGRIIVQVETWGCRYPLLGLLYCKLFYQSMIKKELAAAGLKQKQRVLHIGAGRLPMTATALARMGLQVDAVDHDSEAVAMAQRVIRAFGLDDRVRVWQGDGLQTDVTSYDAVWLSFHVVPKRRLVRRVYANLSPQAALVYRNPGRSLQRLYRAHEAAPLQITKPDRVRILPQGIGRQSVVLQKVDQGGLENGCSASILD